MKRIMSTPREARNFANFVHERGFERLTKCEFLQLTTLIYSLLPQSYNNGKNCNNCSHKMPNRCKTCPDCRYHVPPKASKKTAVAEEVTGEVEDVAENHNLCDGWCKRDLTDKRAIELPCNHTFCARCLKERVEFNHITCCFCDTVVIPEHIRQELLSN